MLNKLEKDGRNLDFYSTLYYHLILGNHFVTFYVNSKLEMIEEMRIQNLIYMYIHVQNLRF